MSTTHNHHHGEAGHTHAAVKLETEAKGILQRGLNELLGMTKGLSFKPLSSERYPLPVTAAVYGETPDPQRVRSDVEKHLETDPVAALESALVLLELYATNQDGTDDAVPDDGAFLGNVFGTKRKNGWVALLGDKSPEKTEEAVNTRWQFKFIQGPSALGPVYVLVNMLCRYGFVYGRIAEGDGHAMGHFIEDFGPGLLVAHTASSDLDQTLSLAAMKLGIPGVVPSKYPFPLGRRSFADTLEDLTEAVAVFPNIRKLLDLPNLPKLPEYLDSDHAEEKFEPATVWGDTEESYYLFRKGEVAEPGKTEVIGSPSGALGVLLTAEAEPLDAFDRQYIGMRAVRTLSMLKGVKSKIDEGRVLLELKEGAELVPERIGEVLIAAVRHEFPKIEKVSARVCLDRAKLADEVGAIQAERAERKKEVESATEDTVDEFVTCVGCSPFAPEHVCIVTPERRPQCARPYGLIKTGALYGYDDMSNIHHRALHAGLNSFGMAKKGDLINEKAGEWSGINEAASELTDGRITRVQLHSLDEAPHTGCSCFRLIMFKTELPQPGIGVMDRKYKGKTPDGRTWHDLHYGLSGKQAMGLAGASPNYLRSARFLTAHDGWDGVVWVCPIIATIMGKDLPQGVEVGKEVT